MCDSIRKSFIIIISFCFGFMWCYANQLAVPGTAISGNNGNFEESFNNDVLKIFIPAEIKDDEGRVFLPFGVKELIAFANDHKIKIQIKVESGAGRYSKAPDDTFLKAGAIIVKGEEEVRKAYKEADIVVKIKEPLKNEIRDEFDLMREGQIWDCFFHCASNKIFTGTLLEKKIVAIALETITSDDPAKKFPCLFAMSVAAGREAILYVLLLRYGAKIDKDAGEILIDEEERKNIFALFPKDLKLLESIKEQIRLNNKIREKIGKGLTFEDENIVLFGCGTSGRAAVDFALLFEVKKLTIIEKAFRRRRSLKRLYKDEIKQGKIRILSTWRKWAILKSLKESRLWITATYKKGDKPKKAIGRDILEEVAEYDEKNNLTVPRIIIPIDSDQGGSVVFVDRGGVEKELVASRHSKPAYFDYFGNIICPIPNLPGMRYLISPTTSKWFTETTLPFLEDLIYCMHGNTRDSRSIIKGLKALVKRNPGMQSGINILMGDLTEKHVAKLFKLKHIKLKHILDKSL